MKTKNSIYVGTKYYKIISNNFRLNNANKKYYLCGNQILAIDQYPIILDLTMKAKNFYLEIRNVTTK